MEQNQKTSVTVSADRSPNTLPKSRTFKTMFCLLVFTISAAAVVPFYFSRYDRTPDGRKVRRLIATHDLWIHLHTMEQFDKGLRSGVIYPRWSADVNHGYGILSLLYYPPGIFYLSSAAHAVFNDWLNSLFLITFLALAGSGFAFYFLARTFYGALASAVAAVLYIMLPMHMLDLYWRGGLPQFIGYIFPPLIIYFAFKLVREGKVRQYAGFAILYGLHVLTHFPVALMFSYALVFLALTWAIKEREWRIAARFACAMGLGLLLSAVYWLPAAIETKYAYEYTTELFPYHQSYITLLPVGDEAGFASFGRVLNALFAFQAVMLIVAILVLRRLEQRNQRGETTPRQWSPISIWVTMGIATTLMCTSFSIYISRLLPKIQVAVPAWRWLTLAGMFTCLLVAAVIDKLQIGTVRVSKLTWVCRAAVAAVILLNVWVSIQGSIIRPLSNQTYHPLASASDVVESSWTPKDATHPQDLPDTPRVISEPEGSGVEISRWDPQDREVHVNADQPTTLRLKTYNFPGWTARVDGRVVPMLSDKDGIQQVDVPPGIHVVRASFGNTPPRTAGALLSGVGLLLIIGLSFAGRSRRLRIETEEESVSARKSGSESVIALVAKSRDKIPLKALGLIAVLAIIAAVIVVITNKRSHSSGTKSDRPRLSTLRVPGSETQLYIAGQDSVLVAVDEKSLDQLVTALSGRDSRSMEALVDSGRAMKVPNDTVVRIIEIGSGKTKVRILEGEHMMVDGWVPERWLR